MRRGLMSTPRKDDCQGRFKTSHDGARQFRPLYIDVWVGLLIVTIRCFVNQTRWARLAGFDRLSSLSALDRPARLSFCLGVGNCVQ